MRLGSTRLGEILAIQLLLITAYALICLGVVSHAVHGDELAGAPVLPPDPRQCVQLAYVVSGPGLPPLPDARQRATLAAALGTAPQSRTAAPCFCVVLPTEPGRSVTGGAPEGAELGDRAHCRWIP